MDLWGYYGRWGISPHPSGVRASIALADPFVVLRRCHRKHISTIDHDNKTCFLAIQKFFDNDSRTCIAKCVPRKHVASCFFCLIRGERYDHAFTRSEAVSLHHNGSALSTDVGAGRVGIGKRLVGSCRYVVTRKEILSKRF